ncbi:MAG TPA: zf-TFIIB domain-containing protein [Candidatus Omnitrophota bacterium]|nr:zf-TFIIB domain-containing protein [Candidatus Omnitrophota bacterium]HPS36521.1 zf-TFIIB domain-containing protein [Candidatus Omnitrophota bacterium]
MSGELKIATRNGRAMDCPKCRKKLMTAVNDGNEVDFCPGCKGVWIDHFEEKRVLEIKPDVFSMDELRRLRKYYVLLGKVEPVRYVPCPVCQNLMNRKIWGSYSGVVVDTCSDHGVWYDEGELQKVKEYIQLGGIEYEKMVKMDQGFNDVHSKLVNEVTRLDTKISNHYMKARLFSMIGF